VNKEINVPYQHYLCGWFQLKQYLIGHSLQTSNKTEINAENICFGWLHVENQKPPLSLLLTLPFSVYITSRCVKTNVHSWPCDTSGCTTNYYSDPCYYHSSSLCIVYIQCAIEKEGRQVQVVICGQVLAKTLSCWSLLRPIKAGGEV
jgi:hypothetical protein